MSVITGGLWLGKFHRLWRDPWKSSDAIELERFWLDLEWNRFGWSGSRRAELLMKHDAIVILDRVFIL
jgi:hypothetical protein